MDPSSDPQGGISLSESSDGLNDSWVKLNSNPSSSRGSGESSPRFNLEKLLVEAQKESGQSSPKSAGSHSSKEGSDSPPLSAHSGSYGREGGHTVHPEQLTSYIRDIRDWSSRPEIVPPSDYGLKYDQPVRKRKHPLSVRNTRVMKDGWFSPANFTTLMVTHSACIVFGLLVGFYYSRNPGTIRG